MIKTVYSTIEIRSVFCKFTDSDFGQVTFSAEMVSDNFYRPNHFMRHLMSKNRWFCFCRLQEGWGMEIEI